MIVILEQKAKHAKWDMLNFNIVIVLHFDGTSSVWVQSLV